MKHYVCPDCSWESDTPLPHLHLTPRQQWYSHYMTEHAPQPLIADVQIARGSTKRLHQSGTMR